MFLLALILGGLGLLLFVISWWEGRRLGLPSGQILAIDGEALERPEGPLVDQPGGLAGTPDYLVWRGGMVVPVEVKTGVTPAEPYESHVLQLAAYCALVEAAYSVRPRYGVLWYPECSFAVEYTPRLERRLRAMVEAIQRVREEVPRRSHQEAQRCRGCSYQQVCDDRLVWPGGRSGGRI